MATVQPHGENLRKAVKWISEERKSKPDTDAFKLAEDAAVRFDLSPDDSEFLLRFIKDPSSSDLT